MAVKFGKQRVDASRCFWSSAWYYLLGSVDKGTEFSDQSGSQIGTCRGDCSSQDDRWPALSQASPVVYCKQEGWRSASSWRDRPGCRPCWEVRLSCTLGTGEIGWGDGRVDDVRWRMRHDGFGGFEMKRRDVVKARSWIVFEGGQGSLALFWGCEWQGQGWEWGITTRGRRKGCIGRADRDKVIIEWVGNWSVVCAKSILVGGRSRSNPCP